MDHTERYRPDSTRWERAYQAFETPDQEVRKFIARLRSIGAHRWERSGRILEVCSGRGSGLRAWERLGFHRIIGVDYSAALTFAETSSGARIIGDVRSLPLGSGSCDVVVVQGGLHHLLTAADVDQALAEMCRVVAPRGRVVIIEPWLTPFLRLVHAVCESPARRVSSRIDALATMIEEERGTYERWLNTPRETLGLIHRHISAQLVKRRWGKLVVVGSPTRS